MDFKHVDSSNINRVAFDEGLIIEYISGAKYKYKGVSKELFDKLLESESKGKFVNAEIKGKYEFEKLVE